MDTFAISKEDDFYAILGCNENSNKEQISTEYRLKAFKYHPDKVESHCTDGIGEALAEDKMYYLIQRAKDVLLDDTMRVKYDKWRQSSIMMSWDQWLALQERTELSMHWASKTKPQVALKNESEGECEQSAPGSSHNMQDVCSGTSVKHRSSLKEFRSSAASKKTLSHFRNYKN